MSSLLIYPVKSCGEVVQGTVLVLAEGFKGDRVFQVTANGKFCTPRAKGMEKLFHIRCLLSELQLRLSLCSDPNLPDCVIDLKAPTTEVEATILGAPRPNMEEILLDYGDVAARWLQKATSIENCRLTGISTRYGRTVVMNPKVGDEVPEEDAPLSLADEAPYLLASSASLEDLNNRLLAEGAKHLDMRRFRPNIVVEGLRPWEEETWKKIRIGDVEFWNWQRCGRCEMTTIDRDTLTRAKEPLKTLKKFHSMNGNINFGIHLVPTRNLPAEGLEIRIGDTVDVLEYDQERVREHQKHYPTFTP